MQYLVWVLAELEHAHWKSQGVTPLIILKMTQQPMNSSPFHSGGRLHSANTLVDREIVILWISLGRISHFTVSPLPEELSPSNLHSQCSGWLHRSCPQCSSQVPALQQSPWSCQGDFSIPPSPSMLPNLPRPLINTVSSGCLPSWVLELNQSSVWLGLWGVCQRLSPGSLPFLLWAMGLHSW